MATITYPLPTPTVTPNSTADPQLVNALTTLLGFANGGVDFVNLSTALQSQVNSGTVGPRGVVNIATSETRTNTAYGTMPTPDQVTGLVLPTNGLIAVWYQATWQESVLSAASAAIFLGANQVKVATGAGGAPVVAQGQTAAGSGHGGTSAGVAEVLSSGAQGLAGQQNQTSPYSGDVTTGQITGPPGGACYIFAAAGTYTVSIQFKASSGSVTASNRKLWVQVQAFS